MSKDSMTVRIQRDDHGRLRFHVDGKNRSEAELQAFGRQVVDKVSQIYIYNRVVTELKQRGIEIQREQVGQDDAVHVYVRNILE